jgi:hypothetical protein
MDSVDSFSNDTREFLCLNMCNHVHPSWSVKKYKVLIEPLLFVLMKSYCNTLNQCLLDVYMMVTK